MLIFLVGRLESDSTDTALLVCVCVCVYTCVYVCNFFFIKIVTFPRCGLSSAQPTSLYEPVWIAVAVLLICNFGIRKVLFP